MADQQLLNHIRQQLAAGVSKEGIIESLIFAGQEASDINDAFSVIENSQPHQSTIQAPIQNPVQFSSPRGHKKIKAIVVALVLLVGAGGSVMAYQYGIPAPSLSNTISLGSSNSKREFIEVNSGGYDDIGRLEVINGKLAYSLQKGSKIYIFYGGSYFGKEYDAAILPTGVNGKLAYVALKDGKYFVVYDGVEFGKQYDVAGYPTEVNRKLAYSAKENGKQFIVYDGAEIGRAYDDAQDLTLVNGKVAYIANNKFVVYDGAELGKERNYDGVYNIFEINGKLGFHAKKDNYYFIVIDGVEREYDGASIGAVVVDGKLAYIRGGPGKEWLIFNGAELGPYHSIRDLTIIDGKLAYTVGDENNKEFVVYDGNEFGKEYPTAYYPVEINGKLAYMAEKQGKQIVVYDGVETEMIHPTTTPFPINGKVTYLAQEGDKHFVVYDGVQAGREYEKVGFPVAIDEKLVYFAKDNGKWLAVMEK